MTLILLLCLACAGLMLLVQQTLVRAQDKYIAVLRQWLDVKEELSSSRLEGMRVRDEYILLLEERCGISGWSNL